MRTHVVSRKNQIRSIFFVVLLMTITIAVILKDYSITEVIKIMKSVHPYYLLAGILMMFVFMGCQAMSFYIVLKRFDHPASFLYCIEYAYVGNYFGAITPGASGGQPAQLYYMNKDDIHVDISAITIFFLVFTSQIAILVIGGVLALLRFPMVNEYKNWLKYLLIAGSAVMIGITLVLTALMFMGKMIPFLFRIILKFGVKCRLIKEPESLIASFHALLSSYQEKSKMILKHPDLFLKVFTISLLQWISYYMVSYLVYLSFGYHEHNAIDLMTGQALINVGVAAVPLPGSVGVAEKAYLNIFRQFYLEQELPSAMILSRIINFYLPLFLSFFVYMIVHFRVVKKKRMMAGAANK